MKLSKKIIAVILAVVICVSAFVVVSVAKDTVFFKTFYFEDGSANQSFYYDEQSHELHVFNEKSGIEEGTERRLGKINETCIDSVPSDIRRLYIHGSVGEIKNIFNDLQYLYEIKIYGETGDIENAFNNCPELQEIDFSCGTYAFGPVTVVNSFNNCNSLERVKLGGDVKIFENSFNDCTNLSYIHFPGKLKEGDYYLGYEEAGYYKDSFNNLSKNGVAWLGCQEFSELKDNQIQNSFKNVNICYQPISNDIVMSNLKLTNGKTGINLTWDNPKGEAKPIYRIEKTDYDDYLSGIICSHIGPCGCFDLLTYCTLLDKVYVESYVDGTVESGETYCYYSNGDVVGITYLSKPVVTSCVSSGSNKATIKWQKVEGAEGYYVYQSTTGKSGSWKKIGNLSGDKLSCTATGLKTNTKYYFCVKAYSGKDVSYGTTKTVTVGVPTILSAKKSGESITLKWAQQSNTVYYRIYAKAPGDAEYTKVATITNPKITSYTFKQFSAQGTQIKVRAFYTSNGKATYATTPLYTVK